VTSPLPPIAFARHPARRGIAWLREAAAMLAAARVRWLMLLLAYYVIQLLVSVIPVVGPLAMMIGRPVFTVGFLAAAWTQQRGGMPEIGHLFRGFRTNLRALLPIGVVLVVGTTFAVLATALVDGGALLDAITTSAKPDDAFVANPRIEARCSSESSARFRRCSPCGSRPRWSSSRIAARGARSPRASALRWRTGVRSPSTACCSSSTAPCCREWPSRSSPSLRRGESAPYVIVLTVVPYLFLFVAAQAISDYVAYRDIFHPDEAAAPPSPELRAP
jgi:hypothetical protein